MASDRPLADRPLALTPGDPAGIGLEIVAKTLAHDAILRGRVVVVGDPLPMRDALTRYASQFRLRNVDLRASDALPDDLHEHEIAIHPVPCLSALPEPGKVSADAGRAAYKAIVAAATLSMDGHTCGMATAPISKLALRAAGVSEPGHTEILARIAGRSGDDQFAMMFASERLQVVLATIHLPLTKALAALTPELVLAKLQLTHDAGRWLSLGLPGELPAVVREVNGQAQLIGRTWLARKDVELATPSTMAPLALESLPPGARPAWVVPTAGDSLAPLYPLFAQDFAQGWPFLLVKSGSKYFTKGKATLGVVCGTGEPLSRRILEQARAEGQDADSEARPSQLAALREGLADLRPRMARIAANTRRLAELIRAALLKHGRQVTLYSLSEAQIEAGLASGILSFYLPAAPTTHPDLVDEFVDYLLTHAPGLVKNRVSYGQSSGDGRPDVFYVINPQGTILAPTFGGGANSLVSEVLGDDAIISSDFGGNPPYDKMKDVARICFKYWLRQSNVLFIIGGKSNNTDIFTTFRAMGDALREHFSEHGPTPLYVVVGRGGPNLIRGMGALQDTIESLGLPYRMFGFDSAISEVVNYAQAADRWMKAGGRDQVAQRLGIRKAA